MKRRYKILFALLTVILLVLLALNPLLPGRPAYVLARSKRHVMPALSLLAMADRHNDYWRSRDRGIRGTSGTIEFQRR